MTLILSNDDVASVLTMSGCMDVLEDAYRDLHSGAAITRRRSDSLTPTTREDAIYGFKTMDGVIPSQGVAAVRLNSDIVTWPRVDGNLRRVKVPAAPNNRWVGLILLFSTENGEPLAIMPDGVVQRTRVGATNGLGVKYMARKDAKSIGILGSGWQAVTQLQAACEVRDIQNIKVFSPNEGHRVTFAQEMNDLLGCEVSPTNTVESCVADVDIVLCSSNSIEAIFFERWLRPGLHVSAIKMPEIEEAALRKADRVALHFGQRQPDTIRAKGVNPPDRRAGTGWAVHEEFDFDSCPKLPQFIAGEEIGRINDSETTCFINDMGLGLQFASAAGLAYRKAKEAGLGNELPTDWFTEDVHP
ncbi:MAG: ornithine cyclodeaminase family protein [Proteobacteria bacterium]|nr:ornithine cyclodeaminase family protein [Pseudomonadota bacterium]